MARRLLAVGALSQDKIHTESGSWTRPGGAALYFSLVWTSLGGNCAIASRIATEYPTEYLAHLGSRGVELSGVRRTRGDLLTFENSYSPDGEREQRVHGEALVVDELGDQYELDEFEVVFLGPILGEIGRGLLRSLGERPPLTVTDPQGLLREVDRRGRISLHTTEVAREVVSQSDVVKTSLAEGRVLTGLSHSDDILREIVSLGAGLAIVTMGSGGSTAFDGDRFYRQPPLEARVVDPTGSGDSFLSAFAWEYATSGDVEEAMELGAVVASLVVEGVGPDNIPDSQSIDERKDNLASE